MKNKKLIVMGVIICATVLVSILGTYAFFLASLGETRNEVVKVQAGTMSLTFSDNSSEINNIERTLNFGDTVEKEFKIENTGTLDAYAKISWDSLTNTFLEGSLTYTLEYKTSETGTYQPIKIKDSNVPTSSSGSKQLIVDHLEIPAGASYIYKITITYNDLDVDQTSDLNAVFATKFTLDEGSKPIPSASETLLSKVNSESVTSYADGNTGEMYAFSHPATTQTEALTDYRYIGANPNNWIRFNDEDWRIIGVFTVETESGEKKQLLKIIRNESLGDIPWTSNKINEWSTASLSTLLNEGDYYSQSGSYASTGLSIAARSQIESVKWYLGGSSASSGLGGPACYTFERGTSVASGSTTNIIQKVGLMYPSDYVYTYANGVDETCYTSGYGCSGGIQTVGWLYNSNYQWTQSPFSLDPQDAFVIRSNGALAHSYVTSTHNVRPVVYLLSDIKITDGDGSSSENAYTIE